jgi:predicted MPP superfamily phosphohydrolase
MAKRKSKRVLFMSDTHCGHRVGLCHPSQHEQHKTGWRNKIRKIQEAMWGTFQGWVDELRPIDICIFVGDAIDGRGQQSKAAELLEVDRTEQTNNATAILRSVRAKKLLMAYGSGYHTGKIEHWEDVVASKADADEIAHKLYPSINGMVFDVKHHVNVGKFPHLHHRGVMVEALMSDLAADEGISPEADWVVRGHAHKYI